MTELAARKAAFVTPGGHYQPRVMMMGLCNAPAKFQELMVRVRELAGEKIAFPYLEDLITASDRYDEHFEQIERILMALKGA